MTRESTEKTGLVLDSDHLEAFTGGDAGLARDILQTFAEYAPGYLSVLETVSEAEWQPAVHKLKGAARGIGAFALAQAAEMAESLFENPEAAYGDLSNQERRNRCLRDLEDHLRVVLTKIGAQYS
ncbi:Hpt domain-containing protein [Eilatimonas milleporae]|uniref:Hpt domain-containing protein n=1 Tax=Eilatimonas milleporae TaxID=911205 RepID=A0A3M0CKR4_9PROT|nr:Hpt domain-containing protein [Eilatimonas milleporae]RMB08980.1 Hpt domain-containing protein [Eilatimonas milleporae]